MNVRSSDAQSEARWAEVRSAADRARQRPLDVIDAVARTHTRDEAAAALGRLLEIEEQLADQLLDLHVSDFIGRAP